MGCAECGSCAAVAQHTEDVTHLTKYLEPPFLVYTAGDGEAAHRADNNGNEVRAVRALALEAVYPAAAQSMI